MTKKKQATQETVSLDPLERLLAKASTDPKTKHLELMALANDAHSLNTRHLFKTGALALDKALGGGFPSGRVVLLTGEPYIGKSLLVDMAIAECQKVGGYGVVLDTEGSRTVGWSSKVGVDPTRCIIPEIPENERTLEHCCDILLNLIRASKTENPDTPAVFALDSVGGVPTLDEFTQGFVATNTKGEIKKTKKDEIETAKKSPATAARAMSAFRRAISGAIQGTKITVMVVTHQYSSIGHGGRKTYGGLAADYLADQSIYLHRAENFSDTVKKQGVYLIGVKCSKNRMGNPFEQNIVLVPGVGVDNAAALLDLSETGYLEKAGAFLKFIVDGAEYSAQGYLKFRQLLADHPDLYSALVDAYLTGEAGRLSPMKKKKENADDSP